MICAKEFIDKFGQIYNFLEDQESRETYMARIHYLITAISGITGGLYTNTWQMYRR